MGELYIVGDASLLWRTVGVVGGRGMVGREVWDGRRVQDVRR